MEDIIAIQQVLNRYSEAASRAAWDEVIATFLPDGVWAVPAMQARFEGHAQILDGLAAFTREMDYIVQVNCPAVIDVNADEACARSVIRECGKHKGRDEALEVLGYYEDRLVRTGSGWRFAERVFTITGMHNFPLSPAAPPAG